MKRKYIIALLAIVFVFSTFMLVGCFEPSTAYIKVSGLKTEYFVGEQLDTTNAIVQYYESKTTEKFSSVPLTIDMVTGFSSNSIGTFNLTVTHKNLITTVSYVIKQPLPPPTSLNKQQAETIFAQTIANMKTYAEIKEVSSISMLGISSETTYITRPTYQYKTSDSDGQSWLFKNDDKWEYYEISYDVFDEVWENNKYEAQLEYDNLIEMQYNRLVSSSFVTIEFVEAYQQGTDYVLVYATPDLMNAQNKILIRDNKIISVTSYISMGATPTLSSTTTLTYFTEETTSVPEIPDKEWIDSGIYFLN